MLVCMSLGCHRMQVLTPWLSCMWLKRKDDAGVQDAVLLCQLNERKSYRAPGGKQHLQSTGLVAPHVDMLRCFRASKGILAVMYVPVPTRDGYCSTQATR